MRFLKALKGRTDSIRNVDVRKGSWFRHVKRMKMGYQGEELVLKGRRPRERLRWVDGIRKDIERRGMPWQAVEECWENR